MWLTGDPAADTLLTEDDNALLIGMVLDQQVPMEKAFSGPLVIAQRMGGTLDVAAIAAMSEEDFVALCSERPAIHRFPGSMAKRVRQVCQVLVEQYDGQAANVWAGRRDRGRAEDGAGRAARLRCPRRPRSSPPCWASAAGCSRRVGARRPAAYGEPGRSSRWPTSSIRSRCARCGRPSRRPRRPRRPPRRRAGLIRRSVPTVDAGVDGRAGPTASQARTSRCDRLGQAPRTGAVNGSRRWRSPPPAGKNRWPGSDDHALGGGRDHQPGARPDRAARPRRD